MKKIKRNIIYILALFYCLSLNAAIFSRKDVIKPSLAILPFENHTGSKDYDSMKIDAFRALFHHLYSIDSFRLIEMEKIGDIIGKNLGIESNFNRDEYIKAVKALGVELILFGNIVAVDRDVTEKKSSVTVSIEARMVRLLNGEIVSMVKKEGKASEKNKNNPSLKSLSDAALDKALKVVAKMLAKEARD